MTSDCALCRKFMLTQFYIGHHCWGSNSHSFAGMWLAMGEVSMYSYTHPPTWQMAPHLDFNLVESLAVVHSNHGPDHLRQDDHVPQVGLHHLWFLHGGSLFLCLTQALQEGLLLAAKATVQPPPLAGTVELHQLLTTKVERTVVSMKARGIFAMSSL